MAIQVWAHGIKAVDATGKPAPGLPPPYFFIAGTAAMAIWGIVAMWNSRLGMLGAWGTLLGAEVYAWNTSQQAAKAKEASKNPSAAAITSGNANYNPLLNRTSGTQAL